MALARVGLPVGKETKWLTVESNLDLLLKSFKDLSLWGILVEDVLESHFLFISNRRARDILDNFDSDEVKIILE